MSDTKRPLSVLPRLRAPVEGGEMKIPSVKAWLTENGCLYAEGEAAAFCYPKGSETKGRFYMRPPCFYTRAEARQKVREWNRSYYGHRIIQVRPNVPEQARAGSASPDSAGSPIHSGGGK